MLGIWIVNAIAFFAAFLLFQIELIIAKILLPAYGGSYLVWGACVVFFQAALLGGYIFVHLFLKLLNIEKYRYLHVVLFTLPLFFFPGGALPQVIASYDTPIVFDIFRQLLFGIGLSFFALSTVSVIMQCWVARSSLPQRTHPYSVYAFSNAGSFVALLSYPFCFEPLFTLGQQITTWRVGYFLLLVFQFILVLFVRVRNEPAEPATMVEGVRWKDILLWSLLGMSGVVFFLSVTTIMTTELAPIPLLWVIPLCIYLLAFVLTFKTHPWCPTWIREPIGIWIGFGTLLYFATGMNLFPILLTFAFYTFLLFVLCMYCQSALYRNRPDNDRHLTLFYVIISFSSLLGGVVVSWILPLVSINIVDFLVGLFILSLALCFSGQVGSLKPDPVLLGVMLVVVYVAWPQLFSTYSIIGISLISLATYFVFGQLSRNVRVLASMMLVLLLMNNWLIEQWTVEDNIFRHRNYYGVMKVRTNLGVNYLTHGSILHGAQSVDPESRHIPLVYYHPKAGVGGIMLHGDFDFTDIGIIGLGTGALAAYGKNGDTIDFYELDEDVYDIAKKYFTFLKYSRARTNVILGDARISLENVPKKKYDLLICDAFGGDSIPVHLLTIEAIDQYRKHLKEGGIVLFHFSNRFLDLGNVLTKNGWENNAHVATKKNSANSNIGLSTSWWMSMTWDKEKHDMMIDRLNWIEPDDTLLTDVRPWSDDYSNITPYIRMRDLWSEFLRFRPFTL